MPKPHNWVVRPGGHGAPAKRLFCFPHAGGGVSAYRSWIDEAGSDVELCLIQYPGRENRIREMPFTRMDDLVAVLVDGIEELLELPFAFYGHSLGAKVAFEAIRELRRRGIALPLELFVGACEAPQVGPRQPLLHRLEESAFLDRIQDRYGGVPRPILDDAELRALLIPMLRADVTLLETYEYRREPLLSCDITVFCGATDDGVERAALESWRRETTGAFHFKVVNGGHFFLQSARRELLDAMESRLATSAARFSEAD